MLKVNHIYQGNCLDILKTFPDDCIDCVVTSPPYYGLRSYGTKPQVWDNHNSCKHDFTNMKSKKINLQAGNPEFKRKWREEATGESSNGYCSLCHAWYGELGQEPTFHLYIDHLVEIFMECRRVLKPTGSMWINIADSYGGNNSVASNNGRAGFGNPREKIVKRGYDKSLLGIPERLAIALTDKGLIRRNTVIWHKRNCLPSSVKDRFTNDFEYFYFFVKSQKYYFKQQFEPFKDSSLKRLNQENFHNQTGGEKDYKKTIFKNSNCCQSQRNTIENIKKNIDKLEGKNKRTVWTLSNKAYKNAHFAVFQESLIETPLKACCSPDGLVLDPFMGSGTVAKVALQQGKKYIGIELNPEYIKLAEERIKAVQIKMF